MHIIYDESADQELTVQYMRWLYVHNGICEYEMYTSIRTCIWSIECRGFESHPRQLIFSRISDCLGCAVLLCLVCLFV